MIYQTFANKYGEPQITWENSDGSRSWTSAIDENSDYQQYLAWVAEGNTATEWSPEA
jgi:hypothetical protein